jgi:putative tryptophan/tyrosine transport system substrate-binding protein
MRRRDFIVALGGAAGWPVVARAQQAALPVVGYLNSASLDAFRELVAGFHRGLDDTGYVEGRNLAIEYRWAQNQNDRLPEFAADLVRRQVAVIVAHGSTPAALAAKAATTTIPIVFLNASDPVEIGLVASLARPGGNITGILNLGGGLIAKRLELLHELVPTATSIAVLVNPTNPRIAEATLTEGRTAARTLGVDLLVLNAGSRNEIEAAFASLVERRAGALLVAADSLFNTQTDQVVALAARYAVPTSYEIRPYVAAGGLMSYGPDTVDSSRQLGVYTGRILKGEKPADLPVQQPTKFEMVINLKTAKALGIDVPTSILLRANAVIE